MAAHLTPLDATFLELEEADDSAHMHIGAVLVFDAPPDGAPTLEQLRRQIEERLPALPRYRERLSEPHTGGLRWPAWVPHEHFDLTAHVREAALPAPADHAALCEWAADYWSHRLDRRLPLWEVVLITGLPFGRWALCTKTHHCLVDGVGSVDAGYLMLDADPDVAAAPAAAGPATHPDGGSGLMRILRAGTDLALHPERLLEMAGRSRAVLDVLVRDELNAAPKTSLNVPIGTRRRFTTVTADLDEVKRLKGELGGTVNDVVLAVVSGGLRRMLAGRGETPPAQGLRAMVPVNVRLPDEQLGNHITSLFVHLPVAEADPAERYRLTRREADSLKSGTQATGSRTLIALTGLAPPVLHMTLARSLFASRLFNVTVTNVPGPQIPLYAFGGRLREVLPLVPLAADHCVGVAIVSYDGRLTFGIVGDQETAPDLAALAAGIEESLAELRALAFEPHTAPA